MSAGETDANQNVISDSGRLFRSYVVGDDQVCVIAEADYSSTCLLMPDGYRKRFAPKKNPALGRVGNLHTVQTGSGR